MGREVQLSPEAREDLRQLYLYIAEQSGEERALRFTNSLAAYCHSLILFPERGTRRDDLRPGLRTTGFRRRATVAFHVTTAAVVIDHIAYGGRQIEPFYEGEDDE